ncbi:MAG: rRNA pseudouridine synthase [Alphaproteobacteria bacterium]|nr:rRNA pseudouridine synthase [Alphaproteobacteria bacterium]
MTIRLSKFIADCGIASRRGAEDLIASGKVSVNDKIIDTPVFFVDGNEKICVDGKEIKKQDEIKVYMFNKPLNTMTTTKDPQNRKTIYDVLDKKYSNLKYIGRLDFKTTGLLLLTNNGDFACKMSLPENHIPRTYIATVNKYYESGLNKARQGVIVDGIKYRPMVIEKIDEHNLRITVVEGKKNEIRIVLKYIGSPVINLHRVSYGPVLLKNLGVGEIKEVDKKTVDLMLKNF